KLDTQTGISGSCEVDINCPEGSLWQTEKRGVAKLVVNGTTLCTGSLVNNTEHNGKPYLLTAGHCIADQDDAWRTVFTFNYERSGCGSGTASSAQTISGSDLISTVSGLDFSLVQLTVPPPPSYKPIYLGWDLDTTGISSTVTIHHPAGDVKKISVDYNAPVIGNFGGGYDYMSHWRIIRWDKGATEGGSSGAPLFNQNHRIIGTLTGGDANCSKPENDYFQRMDRCWDDYEPPANQLRAWLDPVNAGFMHVDYYDPYNYNVISCDTITNILPAEKTGLKTLDFGGYASGHNWLAINGFAESFVLPDSATLSGIFLYPLKLHDHSSADGSYITLFVSSGNLSAENRIYSEKILYSALKANQLNFIPLWHYLPAKDTLYAGYEIYYGQQDTIAMAQTLDRLPGNRNSAFVRYGGTWTPYETVFSNPASFFIGLQVYNLRWLKTGSETSTDLPVQVFPVPTRGELNIAHNGVFAGEATVFVYDLTGRIVWTSSLPVTGSQMRLSFGFLNNGIYILKIMTRNKKGYSFRFIIQK
ncbi:MAG: T9SS type A sorting domain-containing protein, partial [Bacteroidales bacterium]|nr:T9SS type A sorting domain-containing protein [Bacteroidales bacterium]